MTTTVPIIKSLARGNVELPGDALAARVFGELLDLAWPVVTHYRSDLFYDAQWLSDRFITRVTVENFPWTFVWACREYGTNISLFDDRAIEFQSQHNTNVWKCTVLQPTTGHYDLVIETIK